MKPAESKLEEIPNIARHLLAGCDLFAKVNASAAERIRRQICEELAGTMAAIHSKKPSFEALSPEEKASIRRKVLELYFSLLKQGKQVAHAETETMFEWERRLGERCGTFTIKRWVNRVNKLGGIEAAPDSAFLDGRKIPHPWLRKKAAK